MFKVISMPTGEEIERLTLKEVKEKYNLSFKGKIITTPTPFIYIVKTDNELDYTKDDILRIYHNTAGKYIVCIGGVIVYTSLKEDGSLYKSIAATLKSGRKSLSGEIIPYDELEISSDTIYKHITKMDKTHMINFIPLPGKVRGTKIKGTSLITGENVEERPPSLSYMFKDNYYVDKNLNCYVKDSLEIDEDIRKRPFTHRLKFASVRAPLFGVVSKEGELIDLSLLRKELVDKYSERSIVGIREFTPEEETIYIEFLNDKYK